MESSCEGLDVDQETLTGDMNEADIPFETSTDGKYNIDELSYIYYSPSHLTCVHVYISCVFSNMFFLTSSSTGGRSSCVKRNRSEDVVVACPAGGPCGQDGGRVSARPMGGSPYLAAIGSNAARGSRLATYPIPQAGPSWMADTAVTIPQAGPSWRPVVTTPQAGPSWMASVTTPQVGPFADGVPKR